MRKVFSHNVSEASQGSGIGTCGPLAGPRTSWSQKVWETFRFRPRGLVSIMRPPVTRSSSLLSFPAVAKNHFCSKFKGARDGGVVRSWKIPIRHVAEIGELFPRTLRSITFIGAAPSSIFNLEVRRALQLPHVERYYDPDERSISIE